MNLTELYKKVKPKKVEASPGEDGMRVKSYGQIAFADEAEIAADITLFK